MATTEVKMPTGEAASASVSPLSPAAALMSPSAVAVIIPPKARRLTASSANLAAASLRRAARLSVEGMTCSACSGTVEEELKKLPGVFEATVSCITHIALVVYDPAVTNVDTICNATGDVGFPSTLESETVLGAGAATAPSSPLAQDAAAAALELASHTVVLDVKGMKAQTCVEAITRELQQEPSIRELGVSLKTKKATIKYADAVAEAQRFLDAIVRAGPYSATVVPQRAAVSSADALEKHRRQLLRALWFAIPIFILSMVTPFIEVLRPYMLRYVYGTLTVTGLLLTVLTTPMQFWIGWPFIATAWRGLRHGSFNMSLLVAVGTLAAYTYAMISVVHCMMTATTETMDMTRMLTWGAMLHMMGGEYFFETSSTLITFVLLGKYLESRARGETSKAIEKLMGLQATQATVCDCDPTTGRVVLERAVAAADVRRDDVVKVLAGQTLPADGVVVHGAATLDTSMLNGEPNPVLVRAGTDVAGGNVVSEGGPLYVRVSQVGADSQLAQIVRMVQNAQNSKAPIQAFADRIANWFVPLIIIGSIVTFIVWTAVAYTIPLAARQGQPDFLFAFLFALAVLVIACPCALGLATPTAVMVGTGLGAQLGILIKGGEHLECAQNVTAVVFDKTGTLTVGRPSVAAMQLIPSTDASVTAPSVAELCFMIASAESTSSHIIAKALSDFALQRLTPAMAQSLAEPQELSSVVGRGLMCLVPCGGALRRVAIGNRAWMADQSVAVSDDAHRMMSDLESQSQIALALAVDGRLVAVLGLADEIKPESAALVAELRRQKIDVWMCTGDNALTASTVARRLAIPQENVRAEALPAAKLLLVEQLQMRGQIVAMIGDGVNDSAALAKADLGISVGGGTAVAQEAAGLVLVSNDLRDLLTALDLARATMRRIRWNYAFAFFYNVLGIPMAAGVFFPLLLWRLPPELAGACMALSSVSVVCSSLWLYRYKKPVILQSDLKEFGNPDAATNSAPGAHAVCCPCAVCARTRSSAAVLSVRLDAMTLAAASAHTPTESEALLRHDDKPSEIFAERVKLMLAAPTAAPVQA